MLKNTRPHQPRDRHRRAVVQRRLPQSRSSLPKINRRALSTSRKSSTGLA